MAKRTKDLDDLLKDRKALDKKIKDLKDEEARKAGNYLLKIAKCSKFDEFENKYTVTLKDKEEVEAKGVVKEEVKENVQKNERRLFSNHVEGTGRRIFDETLTERPLFVKDDFSDN